MMKNIAPIAKKILIGVPILGAVYVYGGWAQSGKKQTQIEYGKNNQNNDSDIIFVSEGGYISNEAQLSGQIKISYSRKIKTKEINDVFFILEGTVVYNLQNITYKEKKSNNTRYVKSIVQKTKSHKNISETKKNKLVEPGDIYFSSCNDQNDQFSVSNVRYGVPTLSNNYSKQLIIRYWKWIPFIASSTNLQFGYPFNSTSYFFIKNLKIRPPPSRFKYKNISNIYEVQNLISSKSC